MFLHNYRVKWILCKILSFLRTVILSTFNSTVIIFNPDNSIILQKVINTLVPNNFYWHRILITIHSTLALRITFESLTLTIQYLRKAFF